MTELKIAITGFLATLVLLRVLSVIARHLDLVDQPGDRKVHVDAVPLVGGLAIFGGIVFGLLLSPVPLGEYRILFAGTASLLVIGVLDDLHELSARARFVAQILAAVLMIAMGGVLLERFGPLLGPWPLELGSLAVPVTIFCTVGVINAINMMDGIDGLAGSVIAVALISMMTADLLSGGGVDALLAAMLAAMLAFLLANIRFDRPARVFLGDAGSLSMGFALAWLLIERSQQMPPSLQPVTALWVFSLPLLDTVFVMLMRLSQGRSPFAAGQDHIHHLFLRSGFAVNQTLACLTGLTVTLSTLGLLMQYLDWPQWWRFYAFVAFAAAYYWFVRRSWKQQRWLGRPVTDSAACS